MSKGFTADRANAILQANFGPNYSEATIALIESDGEEVDATTDVNGVATPNGYTRIKLGALEVKNGYIQNAEALHFPEAEQAWGTIIGFRIYSNFRGINTVATGTNGTTYSFYSDAGMGFEGSLIEQKPVPKETIPLFRKGYIRIGLDHTPPAIETT